MKVLINEKIEGKIKDLKYNWDYYEVKNLHRIYSLIYFMNMFLIIFIILICLISIL